MYSPLACPEHIRGDGVCQKHNDSPAITASDKAIRVMGGATGIAGFVWPLHENKE